MLRYCHLQVTFVSSSELESSVAVQIAKSGLLTLTIGSVMHDSIELNDELCLRHLVIMFLVVTIITVNIKTKIVSFSRNHCGASLLCVLLLGPDN